MHSDSFVVKVKEWVSFSFGDRIFNTLYPMSQSEIIELSLSHLALLTVRWSRIGFPSLYTYCSLQLSEEPSDQGNHASAALQSLDWSGFVLLSVEEREELF